MGRPEKPPEEKATERLVTRCRRDQINNYQAAADRAGVKLGTWVKMMLDRAEKNSRKK